MSRIDQHKVFREFRPWSGPVKAGYAVNFVGQLIDVEFLRGFGWAKPKNMVTRMEWPDYDPFNVETFEWLMILEALLNARNRFTMVELGAGFGRWIVGAACAARLRRPDLKLRLIGVEPQRDHFQWMHKHFVDNGLKPSEHKLIEGAVDLCSGSAYLVDAPDPSGFWGQYLSHDEKHVAQHVEGSFSKPVKKVTLSQVLRFEGIIDLIDMDIQDSEKTIVPNNIRLLTKRVRRIHIETHWPETHDICHNALAGAGWQIIHSYSPSQSFETEFGVITMPGGGVLTAINPLIDKKWRWLTQYFPL